MAATPRRTADESHLGEMPPPRPHRGVAHPEDGGSRASDILAFLGSGALVMGGTALLAWVLRKQPRKDHDFDVDSGSDKDDKQ